ncbi:class I SAM-dependent methyltransferase [Acidithiobacillus concretivorus]|uniref:Class I SAM-dependent methyltransferase n=1 Tax=Acidithiobacillus concretivorus TaxID=3063952 RepID=A0ABS5ZR26_9PROT|nr:methyltransferase domain-containing protein [Acidithiobacillus concretivorus]MBU2738618.1 class I SAM-dependent methyltransferase [Acidithiobacillus concretivorus]
MPEDAQERQARWNNCYAGSDTPAAAPLPLLKAQAALLPTQGAALDLACGRGANALFLARQGLETWAWDYADAAIAAVQQAAAGLPLHAQCRDVLAQPPEPDSFDVIVVAHFLHRPLFPILARALKAHGLLFYETWAGPYAGRGPQNPDFRLRPGELNQAFPALQLLMLAEEADRSSAIWRAPTSPVTLA